MSELGITTQGYCQWMLMPTVRWTNQTKTWIKCYFGSVNSAENAKTNSSFPFRRARSSSASGEQNRTGQTKPGAEYLWHPGAMDLSAPRPRRRLTINIKSPFWMPSQVAGRGAYLLSCCGRGSRVNFQTENCGKMCGLAWTLFRGC